MHAVGDVSTETAVAEDHAFLRADVLHAARGVVAELVALADFQTLHAAIGIADDCFHEDPGAERDPELFALRDLLRHDRGAGAVSGNRAAGNRVTAFLHEVIHVPFDAELIPRPLPGGERLVHERADFVGIVQPLALTQHVFSEEFRRVLDPILLLHRGSGNRHNAAVDDGVVAKRPHLFENDDVRAFLFRFKRRREPGKTRADDQHIHLFIPLCGHRVVGLRLRSRCQHRAKPHRRPGSQERSSRKIRHIHLLSILQYLGRADFSPNRAPLEKSVRSGQRRRYSDSA